MTEIRNNKRIVKNSLMLSVRMFISMVVSLYTSRVVLSTLGVIDYGIYNVVGSTVAMLSVLSMSMSDATQRFLSIELGREEGGQFQNVFSHSVLIYILLSVIIFILGETIGLWFFTTQINIPTERMEAAQWVYQFTILTFITSLFQAPYLASIMSHEKMDVYAYISIAEVFLKLLIVFMLVKIGFDKLKLYAALTFGVSLLITLSYYLYSTKKLACCFQLRWKKSLFYQLLNFAGWSSFASFASITMGQGINILLNIFFGPAINAARGIAFQINAAISSFANNLGAAVRPQIVKSYAKEDMNNMKNLVFESANYTYYFLFLLALPVFLETHIILSLWLKVVPDYTVFFCQLVIINTLILSFDSSFGVLFQAIGKIKENQLLSGIVYVSILPVTYFFLKHNYPPEISFYIQIVATIIVAFVGKVYLLVKIAKISMMEYLYRTIIPVLKVTAIAIIIPVFVKLNMSEGLLRLFVIVMMSMFSVSFSIYNFGMSKNMRIKIRTIIISTIRTIHIRS